MFKPKIYWKLLSSLPRYIAENNESGVVDD